MIYSVFSTLSAFLPDQEVRTVHFIDTKFSKNEDVKANADGKISAESLPKLEDSTGKYRLLGWTKDTTKNELVDFSTEVITADTNLYSVWVLNVKAVIKLHYDGETETVDGEEVEKVVEIKDKYYAGDTIDFNSEDFKKLDKASNPSKIHGVTYTQSGWHKEGDKKNESLTSYVIPVPEEPTGDEPIKDIEINLHPTWDISVVSAGTMNKDTIDSVVTELKELQKSNKGYCGNIEISSKVNVDKELTIPEGITVTFNDEVVVGNAGSIEGSIVKENGVTIVKAVSANNANAEKIGLNDSLNNDNYDEVKLEAAVTLNDNMVVKKGKDATLNLNGVGLTINDEKQITNNGNLKIKTNTTTDATITIKKGVVNNGTLTIGETVTGNTVSGKVKISSKAEATETTVTNTENATLTLKSGEILNLSTSTPEAVVKNEKGGTLVIEGGKIDQSSNKTGFPALLNEGEATISGGEISRSGAKATADNKSYVVVNHGDLTISNGKFTEGAANALAAGSALITNGYYSSLDGLNKEANLTITGGEFNGGRYIVKSDYAGITTIKGGKYTPKTATGEVSSDSTDETRSIFKTIGEMTLDFSEATPENTSINLGTTTNKRPLVLVGDQKISSKQSKTDGVIKNSITVHPFNHELVKIDNKAISDASNASKAIDQLIVVEKGTDKSDYVKSKIIVYVEDADAKVAGKQLITLMKNFVAKQMSGMSADKNTVKIILGSDVEIEANLETDPGYNLTSENSILELNGHTLNIHSLYTFKNNIKVQDTSNEQTGKIVLSSEKTENEEIEIFSKGTLLSDERLKDIADKEIQAGV